MKTLFGLRVHALSIYAETTDGDLIPVIISGQLSDEVNQLAELSNDVQFELHEVPYERGGKMLSISWKDEDGDLIAWNFQPGPNGYFGQIKR